MVTRHGAVGMTKVLSADSSSVEEEEQAEEKETLGRCVPAA